jgi:hypothetical protein
MDVWDEVSNLNGKTLKTLDKGREFDILDISKNYLFIKIHSTGKERKIERRMIESAYRELALRGEISRADIEKRHAPRHPAYVAAILAETPGVTYTTSPIILKIEK